MSFVILLSVNMLKPIEFILLTGLQLLSELPIAPIVFAFEDKIRRNSLVIPPCKYNISYTAKSLSLWIYTQILRKKKGGGRRRVEGFSSYNFNCTLIT